LLTAKPLLYVANVDEVQIRAPGPLVDAVRAVAREDGSAVVVLSGKIESELAGLSEEEAREFCTELGIERSGLDGLALKAYDLLGLMTFLTAGEKEVRAWTIAKGTKAPQAAGKIHGDIERGFIRAEIVSYDDYVEYKTMAALKNAGKVRAEGKEYVMQEGDVVNFLFNV
jgi:ribosome-binding ATPase YchF (GTP1/OBG family)